MLYTFTVLLSLVTLSLGAVFEVQVGRDETGAAATKFTPNQITAQVGDRVEFVFRGKNHSVTQSSFAQPCTQQLNTATNLPGVDSGFMAVAANASQVPVFSIQVMDATAPQWFFCNQANHCNMGMVFAINAPTTGDKTFDKWVTLAANATHPDPALRQTANFTPAPESGSNTGGSNTGSSGSNTGGENSSSSSSGLSGSEGSGSSFGATPTSLGSGTGLLGSGSGSGSGLNSATSATVFIGSIPASSATAVANAADTAPTTTTSSGFKMEPRNVLGMAILGAMSFALAW